MIRQLRLSTYVALLSWQLVACDASTFVRGVVRDETGVPIEGATIELSIGERKVGTVTRDDGSYEVDLVHGPVLGGELTLTVSRAGFHPISKRVRGNGSHALDLVITREASQ
jgi:hypothetical protein